MGTKLFVSFRIDDHLVGIDVMMIQEINRVLGITPVPHAPEYVLGLVNLRGKILTIFDLGLRLGLEPRIMTEKSHNVIFKNDLVGLLVDDIGDVVKVEENMIDPVPPNVDRIESKFIDGVAKLQDELLLILSTEKLLEYQSDQKRTI